MSRRLCIQQALTESLLGSCPAFTLCLRSSGGDHVIILATDMARHAEIMDSFKEKMENFDYSNEEHMTLVSGLSSLSGGLGSERHPQLRLETEAPKENV